eukprot:TRINITY_DN12235_c0_g1_i4.p1 TRINITY_DN12235_c0_g1~~TRINITY_DN12235_c0_g1_i4.p1  ORF type:complete len:980 (+),score=224.59 TRINITY_DN12235_c0_g1_i4:50-2941(+)
MEIVVTDCDAFPKGSVISIRAGSMRRQAPVSALSSNSLKFPALAGLAEPLKVDLLQPFASHRLVLAPNKETYRLEVPTNEGTIRFSMRVRADKPTEAGAESPGKMVCGTPASGGASIEGALKYTEAASCARQYLEVHKLLQYFQGLLHAVIQVKPDDPYRYMWEQLGSLLTEKEATQAPQEATQAARPPELSPERALDKEATQAAYAPNPCAEGTLDKEATQAADAPKPSAEGTLDKEATQAADAPTPSAERPVDKEATRAADAPKPSAERTVDKAAERPEETPEVQEQHVSKGEPQSEKPQELPQGEPQSQLQQQQDQQQQQEPQQIQQAQELESVKLSQAVAATSATESSKAVAATSATESSKAVPAASATDSSKAVAPASATDASKASAAPSPTAAEMRALKGRLCEAFTVSVGNGQLERGFSELHIGRNTNAAATDSERADGRDVSASEINNRPRGLAATSDAAATEPPVNADADATQAVPSLGPRQDETMTTSAATSAREPVGTSSGDCGAPPPLQPATSSAAATAPTMDGPPRRLPASSSVAATVATFPEGTVASARASTSQTAAIDERGKCADQKSPLCQAEMNEPLETGGEEAVVLDDVMKLKLTLRETFEQAAKSGDMQKWLDELIAGDTTKEDMICQAVQDGLRAQTPVERPRNPMATMLEAMGDSATALPTPLATDCTAAKALPAEADAAENSTEAICPAEDRHVVSSIVPAKAAVASASPPEMVADEAARSAAAAPTESAIAAASTADPRPAAVAAEAAVVSVAAASAAASAAKAITEATMKATIILAARQAEQAAAESNAAVASQFADSAVERSAVLGVSPSSKALIGDSQRDVSPATTMVAVPAVLPVMQAGSQAINVETGVEGTILRRTTTDVLLRTTDGTESWHEIESLKSKEAVMKEQLVDLRSQVQALKIDNDRLWKQVGSIESDMAQVKEQTATSMALSAPMAS